MSVISRRKQGELGGFSDRTSDIILIVFSLIILLIVAYPLYYVLVASLSDPYDVYAGKTFLLPSKFTFEGYKAVFAEPNIVRGYGNSILYTVLGTIYSVTLIYLVGYPLSVPDLPGKKIISIFFIITMYFGGGLIPTYLIVQQTGIMQTIWAMFLPGGVAVSNAIIARNYFENSIPGSLKEAAGIDGAGHFRIFFSMIIPLSMPILSVMVIFSMVAYWNDWFTALIYLQKDQYPFPLVLRGILITTEAMTSMTGGMSYAESNRIAELVKFASMIVAAAPMLIMYPFVQKYFEQGFMTGAVKG